MRKELDRAVRRDFPVLPPSLDGTLATSFTAGNTEEADMCVA